MRPRGDIIYSCVRHDSIITSNQERKLLIIGDVVSPIKALLRFLLLTALVLKKSYAFRNVYGLHHASASLRTIPRHRELSLFAEPSLVTTSDKTPTSTQSTSTSVPPFQLQRIDHIVIRCRNFPAMFDFYHRILGCTIDEPRNEHMNRFGGALTHLRAGSCYIDLLSYDKNHLTEEGKGAAARMHAGGAGMGDKSVEDVNLSSDSSTLDHLCLRVEPFDADIMLEYLEKENVDIVVSGEKRLGADGVGPSVYVRDPEGNVIELKGPPYQQRLENNAADTNQQILIDDDCKQEDTQQSPKSNNNDIDMNADHNTSPQTENNPSQVPITPCIRICRYNSSFYDGKVCIGCFREAYEIQMWQSMSQMEKSMTLLDAIDRCSENDQSAASSEGHVGGDNFEGAITEEELTRQYRYWADLAEK